MDLNKDLLIALNEGNLLAVKQALEKGADVNTILTDSTTLLMFAIRRGNTDAAKLLIEKGADINAKTNDGITVLMVASLNGNTEVAKLLIQKGANINAKDDTDAYTALIIASFKGNTDIVKLLIEAGADVNAKDDRGTTALIHVSSGEEEHKDVAKFLIEAGADINAKDNVGATAIEYAYEKGYTDVVALLENVGATLKGAGKKKCFVATATYGDSSCEQLRILRNFRDYYLVKRIWGKFFIFLYYLIGPFLAMFVKRIDFLKVLSRKGIDYIVERIK